MTNGDSPALLHLHEDSCDTYIDKGHTAQKENHRQHEALTMVRSI